MSNGFPSCWGLGSTPPPPPVVVVVVVRGGVGVREEEQEIGRGGVIVLSVVVVVEWSFESCSSSFSASRRKAVELGISPWKRS